MYIRVFVNTSIKIIWRNVCKSFCKYIYKNLFESFIKKSDIY